MAIEEKPSRNEDEFFVRMDAELVKARRAALDEERKLRERASHLGKCPRCGSDIEERSLGNVRIDECPECRGIWLDKGELELLRDMGRDSGGFIGMLLGMRK